MRKLCLPLCLTFGLALPTAAFADELVKAACAESATTLCLLGGEFQVTATFANAVGGTGHAQAVKLTDDTGYLWFFGPSNVEVVIKALDGCPVNAKHWVFAGGLTNVHVDITVTDLFGSGSAVRHYINPANTAFQPIQDTSAFDCVLSSARFKQDVTDMGDSSASLMKLRPVTFHYRSEVDDGTHNLQYGLIAEEVAKVYPNLVQNDKDGKPLLVRYHLMNAMLLNELQKQQHEAERQNTQIEELRQQLQALVERLDALLRQPAPQ